MSLSLRWLSKRLGQINDMQVIVPNFFFNPTKSSERTLMCFLSSYIPPQNYSLSYRLHLVVEEGRLFTLKRKEAGQDSCQGSVQVHARTCAMYFVLES